MPHYSAEFINGTNHSLKIEAPDFIFDGQALVYDILISPDDDVYVESEALILPGESKYIKFQFSDSKNDLEEFINIAPFILLSNEEADFTVLTNEIRYWPAMTSQAIKTVLEQAVSREILK